MPPDPSILDPADGGFRDSELFRQQEALHLIGVLANVVDRVWRKLRVAVGIMVGMTGIEPATYRV